jgi:DUF4097 and DUF4098 domain-containing protein YvlB
MKFTIFFIAANAIEKQPEESGLVERVVKTYAEKTPKPEYFIVGKTDISSETTSLIIETQSDDITLVKADSIGKIEVFGTKEANEPKFTKNGNELKLEYESSDNDIHWSFTFNDKNVASSSGIQVYVPKNIKTITLATSSGDIKLNDVNTDSLNFTTSSGDIRIKNSATKQATLLSSSGDQRIELSVNALNSTTSSGDQTLNLKDCLELNAIASSGDIRMDTSCETSSITTSSGDITLEENGISKKIDAISSSGDIRIKFQTEKPSIKVSFTTNSGDLINSKLKEQITQKVDDNNFTLNSGTTQLNVTTSSGDLRLTQKPE